MRLGDVEAGAREPGVGMYKPKQSELDSMAFRAGSGSGFAQYVHSAAKAALTARVLRSVGSVEMMKPSRVHTCRVEVSDVLVSVLVVMVDIFGGASPGVVGGRSDFWVSSTEADIFDHLPPN